MENSDEPRSDTTQLLAVRVAGIALAIVLIASLAYFAAFHARFLNLPGPQETRESSIPLTTSLMLKGGRPYNLESSPAITNVYGVVYNYALLPAAKIWGATFLVHRAGSLVFLLLGAALLFVMLRKSGVGGGLALGGAAFYYLFNATTYAICARPDTLGGGLMLAVLIFVMPGRGGTPPSWVNLALSAALGVLAFYTKPYFVLAIPLAAAGLWVTVGLRLALLYSAIAGGLMLASLPLINYFWPYYLFSIYTTHVYSEIDPPGYFSRQFMDFLLLHAGLLLAAVGAGACWLRRTANTPADPSQPWWRRWAPTPSALQLLAAFGAATVVLGSHSGAFRIYYVQLVTPFLLLGVLSATARAGRPGKAAGLGLLTLNAVILLTWARPPWPVDSTPAHDRWTEISAGLPWQLLPPAMMPDEPPAGAPLVENGQMAYFANIALDHLDASDPAHQRVVKYLLQVQAFILQRRFDIIAGPNNDFKEYIPKDLLEAHYHPYVLSFPIYFFDYSHPRDYGSSHPIYEAWVRNPGMEHAFDPSLPVAPPHEPSPPPAAN